jgi:phosphoglycolate phosphatase-like HAD superfamily hydrolase
LRIPLAILSNKPHVDVLKVVAHFFENSMFSAIAGQRSDERITEKRSD